MSTPGSTHASRLTGSTDSTRFILVSVMTTAPSSGVAPPARPVPAPRATNGVPWATATRTTACTSSVVVGKHDHAGGALDVGRVAPVQAELGRAGAHPVGRQRPAQRVDDVPMAARALCRRPVTATSTSRRWWPSSSGAATRPLRVVAHLAQHDHLPGLDRAAVDEHGLDVVDLVGHAW